MIALDFISNLSPVQENESVATCMNLMLNNLCYQLPVVKNGKLYGTVDLDECMHTDEKTIENLVDAGFASVHFNSHLFDVLRVFNESKSDIVCVLGEGQVWVGALTKAIVLEALADSLSINQEGAVIIVEMASTQYSSSEISRIIESEGAQLLGLWITNVANTGRIRASLKLNVKRAERVISSLQRFNYEIIAAFGDEDYKENVERRFHSLMKYLDI